MVQTAGQITDWLLDNPEQAEGLQDSWLSKKAEEIQSFADRKDMMHIKMVCELEISSHTPLSADGSTLLND